eukprot:scaffold132193_cov37-Attheya_sp.AAC.1
MTIPLPVRIISRARPATAGIRIQTHHGPLLVYEYLVGYQVPVACLPTAAVIGVVELEGYHARKQRDSEDFRGNLRAPNRLPH